MFVVLGVESHKRRRGCLRWLSSQSFASADRCSLICWFECHLQVGRCNVERFLNIEPGYFKIAPSYSPVVAFY